MTHEQQRNKKGVDHKKIVGQEEKGAMCITRTDRGRGGTSQGISRRGGREERKDLIIPVNSGRVNTWAHTEMVWGRRLSGQTHTQA